MEILKNAGKSRILQTTPLSVIEDAGRTCYQSKDKITPDSSQDFIRKIMRLGHHSVLEHSVMTVEFSDVSRGFTHEMVRHRLCAFSQESTRYVDESEFKVVCPPNMEQGTEDYQSFVDWMTKNEGMYRCLRATGWKPQDARQVLPIAIKSQIVVSTNYREWRHIFSLRCDKAAHWEIRGVMCNLLEEVKKCVPLIYDDLTFAGKCKDGVPYYVKNGSYKEQGMPTVYSDKDDV